MLTILILAMMAIAAVALVASSAPGGLPRAPWQRVNLKDRDEPGMRSRKTKTGLGFFLPFGHWLTGLVAVWRIWVARLRNFGRRKRAEVLELGHGLASAAHPRARVFALGPTVVELEEKLTAIVDEAKAIQAKADGENRTVTEEETKRIEALDQAFDATTAEIDRRKRLAKMDERMRTPQRKTQPDDPSGEKPISAEVKELQRRRDEREPIRGGDAANAGTMGFETFGKFAQEVLRAVVNPNSQDARLRPLAASVSTYSSEGVGADGGYLIPPDFRTQILKKVMGEDTLIQRTDQQTTSSNTITFPSDETTPWQTTGGILAFWEGEQVALPQSKVALQAVNIRANKLTALVPVTDEQLEDGPSLEAYLRRKAPDKLNFKVNDAIVNGSGVGIPLGLLNSGAKVTVSKEAGQATGTINFQNIVKMWSRMYDPCRRNAIWLINQDIEQQLFQLVVPGTQAAFPAYLPPGGLSNSPYGTIMGRPVVYTEAAQALSTEGDIILWDPTTYLSLLKATGLRSDVSIHLWFDQDLTAFRFIMRLGGAPWWKTAITRKNGTNTLSCIVTLQTR